MGSHILPPRREQLAVHRIVVVIVLPALIPSIVLQGVCQPAAGAGRARSASFLSWDSCITAPLAAAACFPAQDSATCAPAVAGACSPLHSSLSIHADGQCLSRCLQNGPSRLN